MCIAIFQPAGKTVPKKYLKESRKSNKDGMGFVYAHEGRLHVEKEMSSFSRFYKKYREIVTRLKPPMAIHFRIGTHGDIDLKNCHPFLINEDLAFCHNGIIDVGINKTSKTSDTYEFNEKILKTLPPGFLENGATLELIDEFVGYSKLVFLDSNGKETIIGEGCGQWEDGIWYSNGTYKPYKYNASQNYNYDDDYGGEIYGCGDWRKTFGPVKYHYCTICEDRMYTDKEIDAKKCYQCQRKEKDGIYTCRVCKCKLSGKGEICVDCHKEEAEAKKRLKATRSAYEYAYCDVCAKMLVTKEEVKHERCDDCYKIWKDCLTNLINKDELKEQLRRR